MRSLWALVAGLGLVTAQEELFYDADQYPLIPNYGPLPGPSYMVDNQKNYYKVAPDKGKQDGADYHESGDFHAYMKTEPSAEKRPPTALYNETLLEWEANVTYVETERPSLRLAETGYWLPKLAGKGKQPIAGGDYKFYRSVTDYGAKGDGTTDDTEAINAAIEDGNRCGRECGNTFSHGAIIYFPPGTYKVCRPIIQLYYTQFIGDAIDMPTLKGCDKFKGIAIVDTDPYIPEGNGANWYINQNQFFRQIRNIRFDLREMPLSTDDHDQPLVPTGIHWQVSQACSLQNLLFEMPDAKDDEKVTHVGIFMENGSGGFVSDLTFRGGSIGWRAGSQQYTVINLKFENCLTAVQMIWDWGFNWQRVEINGGAIGFNISGVGGIDGQGVGSISLIDSKITNCPIGILTRSGKNAPNIVIDNLEMSGVAATIRDTDGNVILGSSGKIDLWALGKRYDGYEGKTTSGAVEAPKKSTKLLDSSGKLFYRPRPQYEDFDSGQFRIATDHGCKNDGTGDNTNAINTFLRDARSASQIAYFPAGIYRVGGTVLIPTGSRVVGASWSQIQGAGAYFSDVFNPRVVVQVGQKGDVGTMEISDMMFNVQGATAGAIVLEWNVHESSQGSAAMWDSHVRVGGATGSDLDVDTCPKFGFNEGCICASMLFHITPQASGYFENMWIWLADHDNDMVVSDSPDKLVNQISIYAARGTLIESEGPTWLYGTGSEHVVLYQYQLYGAKDVYLGHIQTETPYYQPVPVAPLPFEAGKSFPGDPSFEHCTTEGCKEAWGLRIIDSEGITLHSVGMYSFFQEYYQDCLETFDCQERICEVKGSKDVALFNVFTVGTVEVASGINDGAIMQDDDNQRGFTTEISVWIPLEGDDKVNIVYVGPEVYTQPDVTCSPPCLLVFPTSSLSEPTTINPGTYTTSLEYGASTETTIGGQVVTTFITTITTVTLPLKPVTTDGIAYSNYNVTGSSTVSSITVLPSIDLDPVPVPLPDGQGGTTTRTVRLPPWPDVTRGPPEDWGNAPGETSGTVSGTFRTPFTTVISATGPTVTTISFPATVSPFSIQCPPDSEIVFNTPRTTLTTDCETSTEIRMEFKCPATRVITFIGASTATISADCTIATAIDNNPGDNIPTTQGPTTTDEPPVTGPLPTYTTFPAGQIEAVEEDDDDDDDVVGFITPCNLWFFNVSWTHLLAFLDQS
ncbi:glucan 1,3-beta-glucosidase [Colletotrichum sojae]|uniref:Glucan 1,3-beta-glucosidase n=1 Tax=Colletotrichum sojae TaxID=2175907 RepID=A0A8H6MPT8_9PEZI|nr:glucan 1,3-beta-glucosidase [Colletotrichum sojae]